MPTASAIVRTTIPEELGVRLRSLGARYGVQNIRVFGSAARGEAGQDSDVDLLVDYVPGREAFFADSSVSTASRTVGRFGVSRHISTDARPQLKAFLGLTSSAEVSSESWPLRTSSSMPSTVLAFTVPAAAVSVAMTCTVVFRPNRLAS
jgi:hypothetical protein